MVALRRPPQLRGSCGYGSTLRATATASPRVAGGRPRRGRPGSSPARPPRWRAGADAPGAAAATGPGRRWPRHATRRTPPPARSAGRRRAGPTAAPGRRAGGCRRRVRPGRPRAPRGAASAARRRRRRAGPGPARPPDGRASVASTSEIDRESRCSTSTRRWVAACRSPMPASTGQSRSSQAATTPAARIAAVMARVMATTSSRAAARARPRASAPAGPTGIVWPPPARAPARGRSRSARCDPGGLGRRHALAGEAAHHLEPGQVGVGVPAVLAGLVAARAEPVALVPRAQRGDGDAEPARHVARREPDLVHGVVPSRATMAGIASPLRRG